MHISQLKFSTGPASVASTTVIMPVQLLVTLASVVVTPPELLDEVSPELLPDPPPDPLPELLEGPMVPDELTVVPELVPLELPEASVPASPGLFATPGRHARQRGHP